MKTSRFRKSLALLAALLLAFPVLLSSDLLYAGAFEGPLEGPRPVEGGGSSGDGYSTQGGGSYSSGPVAEGSTGGSASFPGGSASYNASGSVGSASAHGNYSASANNSGIQANVAGGGQVNVAQGQFGANAQVSTPGNVAGANASVNAQGNVGAQGQGSGNLTVGPGGIDASGQADAFTGAQVSGGGTAAINLFGLEIGINLGGDGYAGLGVHVNGHFQATGTGISTGLGIGAAAGVGAGGNVGFYINYGGLVDNVVDAASWVGSGLYNIGSSIWNWFGGGEEVQEALPNLSGPMQFDGSLGNRSGGANPNILGQGFSQTGSSSTSTPASSTSTIGVPCPGEH